MRVCRARASLQRAIAPQEAAIDSPPEITVVIPHFNEPVDLDRTLAALARQREDGVSFEVIVVDNGSHEMPVAVCARYDRVRLVREPVPGPGPARNRGARLAEAPILAFLDADCVPEPGWARAIAETFAAHPEIDVIAGDLGVLWRREAQPTALEIYDALYSYRARMYAERQHYAATGNMAVRRRVFQRVGPFAGIAVMEDRDWGQRATALGYRLAFVGAVRAMTPASRSFDELARRWSRHVGHEFEAVPPGALGMAKWALRGFAVGASPLAEAARLMLGPSGYTLGERLAAWPIMARIRLYRARTMLGLIGRENPDRLVGAWRR